jgi:hypothetical protein
MERYSAASGRAINKQISVRMKEQPKIVRMDKGAFISDKVSNGGRGGLIHTPADRGGSGNGRSGSRGGSLAPERVLQLRMMIQTQIVPLNHLANTNMFEYNAESIYMSRGDF